jgi:hypothetical protein
MTSMQLNPGVSRYVKMTLDCTPSKGHAEAQGFFVLYTYFGWQIGRVLVTIAKLGVFAKKFIIRDHSA